MFISILIYSSTLSKEARNIRTSLIIRQEFKIYTSYITLTEILPPLVKRGDKSIISSTIEFIQNKDCFHLARADKEICVQAGFLRGELGIKTPDALHVATTFYQGCYIFLTNDAGICVPKNIRRILLSEYQ